MVSFVCKAGGGDTTEDVEMTQIAPVGAEVTQVVTPGTLPSAIDTDDEYVGAHLSEFPPLPSMVEGRDELLATPSPPSSSSLARQHVEDGQMPSTSTSVVQTIVQIKRERNEEGGDLKPKFNGLDRGSLTAWVDAQDEKFKNMEARYRNEQLWRKNAQDKL